MLARYGLGQALPGLWTVVWINVAGSFLLGALVTAPGFSHDTRLILGVGFLGGFTTFSTFTVQIVLEADGGGPIPRRPISSPRSASAWPPPSRATRWVEPSVHG